MYPVSDGGNHKGNLKPSEPLVDKGAMTSKRSRKQLVFPNQLSLFAMRESVLIPSAMILSDKLNSFVQNFRMRNFYQTLAPGLILGGENSLPFWTEFSLSLCQLNVYMVLSWCTNGGSGLLAFQYELRKFLHQTVV